MAGVWNRSPATQLIINACTIRPERMDRNSIVAPRVTLPDGCGPSGYPCSYVRLSASSYIVPTVPTLTSYSVGPQSGTHNPEQSVIKKSKNSRPNACLLDEHEVAQILNVSVATIRRRRLLRQEPHPIKIGSSVRYRREDIDALIQNCATDRGGRAVNA